MDQGKEYRLILHDNLGRTIQHFVQAGSTIILDSPYIPPRCIFVGWEDFTENKIYGFNFKMPMREVELFSFVLEIENKNQVVVPEYNTTSKYKFYHCVWPGLYTIKELEEKAKKYLPNVFKHTLPTENFKLRNHYPLYQPETEYDNESSLNISDGVIVRANRTLFQIISTESASIPNIVDRICPSTIPLTNQQVISMSIPCYLSLIPKWNVSNCQNIIFRTDIRLEEFIDFLLEPFSLLTVNAEFKRYSFVCPDGMIENISPLKTELPIKIVLHDNDSLIMKKNHVNDDIWEYENNDEININRFADQLIHCNQNSLKFDNEEFLSFDTYHLYKNCFISLYDRYVAIHDASRSLKFWGHKKLQAVYLIAENKPEFISSTFSGSHVQSAYFKCPKIEMPEGFFRSCKYIETVFFNTQLDVISSEAFQNCSKLISINLPYGITEIKTKAFERCNALQEINLPSTITNIGEKAFSGSGITEISISSSFISIHKAAFSHCNNLKSVTFEHSCIIDNIGAYAFSHCPLLKNFRFPASIQIISEGLFSNCHSLEDIVFNNGICEIQDYSFYGCSSLKHINFNQSIDIIGHYSFGKCEKLENIILPTRLRKISSDAFSNCKNLKIIQIDIENENYSSIDGCLYTKDSKKLLICPEGKSGILEIQDGVLHIDSLALDGCNKLEAVVLPKSLRNINMECFETIQSVPIYYKSILGATKLLRK